MFFVWMTIVFIAQWFLQIRCSSLIANAVSSSENWIKPIIVTIIFVECDMYFAIVQVNRSSIKIDGSREWNLTILSHVEKQNTFCTFHILQRELSDTQMADAICISRFLNTLKFGWDMLSINRREIFCLLMENHFINWRHNTWNIWNKGKFPINLEFQLLVYFQ